ncbi:hypothetical protein QQZ08_005728 [Neonectria magnoliae]|uniref:Uncharacterized protein n=1 Tax=Neonectria magnoliae TaxID=2732573 RepID=A0ABR1I454_9HYPO
MDHVPSFPERFDVPRPDDNTQKCLEDVATSHTSLAQGYLLLDQFQPTIEHCQKCISLGARLPDVQSSDAIPQFALIYQAWGWLGLGDYGKAADLASQVIQFRENKFGPNDKQSLTNWLELQAA